MKKALTISVWLMLIVSVSFAQYSTDWIRPGDMFQKTGVMLVQDRDDNVVVTGYYPSNNIYTRKYDKFGNLQWERSSTSGVAGNYEKPVWANADSTGNIFVVGYRHSTASGTIYPNALVVLKYDAAGTLLWKNTIAMTIFVNNFISFNLRSEVDAAGNLYIGTVAVTPSGFVLTKLDPSGAIVYTVNNNLNGVTMFRSMRLKGNRIIFGGSSGNLSLAPLVAWDTSGNLLWTAALTGQSTNDVELDDAGDVYAFTSYPNQVSPSSAQDILVYKLNSTGSQLWVKNFDFGGSDFPVRFTLVAGRLSAIGYGSVGGGYFDWLTFQLDAAGNMLWNTRYNETTINDEQPGYIVAKENGEVFVTGRGGPLYTQPTGSSFLRMITLKYDNTGTRKWVDSVNIYSGRGMACALASDNSLYVVSDAYTTAFHFLDHTGTGPCTIPTGQSVSNPSGTTAIFSWTPVSSAYLYHLRYKQSVETVWNSVSVNVPTVTVNGLSALTTYEYACEAVCPSGPSGFSTTQIFTTPTVVLAVNGLELRAVRQGTNVLLNWTTQSEQNSAYFDVERSNDGIAFTKAGQVPAAGNSTQVSQYRFSDLQPGGRILYYRVKAIDRNGTYKLSNVRVITREDALQQDLVITPNPASAYTNLVFTEAVTEDMQLQIINPVGQVLRTEIIRTGTQTMQLQTQDLRSGIYMVVLSGRNSKLVKRLVKK